MPIDELEEQQQNVVELSRKAVAALSEEREMLFVQGNRLVDVDFGDGKITVERVNRQRLIYHMRRCLDWDNKQLGIVASDLMQHKSFKTFRRLEGTYTAPTFRSDFTLIRPGYDESTGSLYMPPADLKDHRFNFKATQDDARNAYERLLYPFSDFPFKSDADKINVVAFLLTLVCRTALDMVIPVLAVDANGQSVGKTLLSKAICRIAFGYELSPFNVPSTKREWEIKMDALTMSSEKIACLDNINGRFSNDNFASLVTSKLRKVRALGRSTLYDVKNELAFVLNGNNIRLDTDTAQRIIWVNMWHPDPTSRDQNKFTIWNDHRTDLESYLAANRVQYLDAVVTMILAWRNAGMPERHTVILNKYGDWERKIGGMLEFAGVEGFLANHAEKTEDADDEKQEIIRFLEAVGGRFRKPGWASGYNNVVCEAPMIEVAALMVPDGEWAGILSAVNGTTKQQIVVSLGKFIADHEKKPFGGYFMQKRKTNKGMALIVAELPK
jgi:hypothetical protein